MPLRPFGWPEWLAIAGTVMTRLAAVLLASRGPVPWVDLDGYLVQAAVFGSSSVSWFHALTDPTGVIRPPIYLFLLSAALRAGVTPAALLVMQAVAAAGGCVAVILLARHVGSRRTAVAAAWCFALSPGAIGAAPAFWSEHVYVPLAAAGLVLVLSGARRLTPRTFGAAGAVFAAAALTRSMPIYVLPLMAAVVYARIPGARRGVVLMLVVFAVVVGVYVAVVSRAAGRLVIVENIAELHWHLRESPASTASPGLPSVLPAMTRIAGASPAAFAREVVWQARSLLRPAPWDDITRDQFPAPFLRLLRLGALALLAVIVVLPIRGLVAAEQRTAALVLAVWVLAQVPLILLSGTAVVPRFRAPLDPALLALAAAALRRL